MDLEESDMLFIDVDAATPAVKQEQEEIPVHESSPENVKTYEDCDTLKSTSTKKRRIQNKVPSAAQVAHLVDRMVKNPVIARGSLRTAPDRQRARRYWDQICQRLNRMPGSTKTLNQWMKYWSDKKKFVQKKAAHRSRLTDIEEKVLCLGGGGAITYRNFKRNTAPPKLEAETENSHNLPGLDISDDEFSQNLKYNVAETDGYLDDTSQSAGPSLNHRPHYNCNLGLSAHSAGHNKSTSSKCDFHAQQNTEGSKFERILKIEERRLSLEQSNAQLMRTILDQSAERERTILDAVKNLSERLNERNEREAMMAGALKTLGDGLLALSKVIKNNR